MAPDLALETLKGVGPKTSKKLIDAGIVDIMALAVQGAVIVKELTGCDDDAARAIVGRARERLQELGILGKSIRKASDVLKERQEIQRISCGTYDALDEFLGGGLEVGAITEIYGEFGCGKTQFAHQFAVQAQRPPEEGGLGKPVIYIDTENTFRPERIRQMAEIRGMDPKKALDGITVMSAWNAAHQTLLLEEAMRDYCPSACLLIVDSITKHYRYEFTGQGWLARRQQALGGFVRLLGNAATMYDMAVIATNQVVGKPDEHFGLGWGPVGGHVLGHASTYRIEARKVGKKKKVLKMVDSPGAAQLECTCHIGAAGLQEDEDP